MGFPVPLTLKIANTEQEYLDAGKVLYSSYLVSGLISPTDREWVLHPYQLVPSSYVIVIYFDGIPCATVTIIGDRDSWLPSQDDFPSEVASIRKLGKIAEIGCLASRSSSLKVISLLLNYAKEIGEHCYDAYILCCHPDHIPFYRKKYSAEICSPVKPVTRVNGSPGVLLFIPNPTNKERMEVSEYTGVHRDKPIDLVGLDRPG